MFRCFIVCIVSLLFLVKLFAEFDRHRQPATAGTECKRFFIYMAITNTRGCASLQFDPQQFSPIVPIAIFYLWQGSYFTVLILAEADRTE